MENLLASPETENSSLLLRNSLIKRNDMNHSPPIIPPTAEETINDSNISEHNISEVPPVALNIPVIRPETIIIDPIPVVPQSEPTVDNVPNNTVRNNSRIPVLSPVLNPIITRLRTSNVKPKGFYKT